MRFVGAAGGEASVSGMGGRDVCWPSAPSASGRQARPRAASRRSRPCTGVAVRAEGDWREQGRPAPGAAAAPDPFRSASRRLESLLAGVGDGEEELLDSMLREEPAERKLQLALLTGGLISGGAALACWACGLDPLGGASLSLSTAKAAGVGGVAAVPLVALKAALWSDAARAQLPFLDDLQRKQVAQFASLLYALTPAQMTLVLSMEVLPGLLILLPAACGGIAKCLSLYIEAAGAELPAGLPAAAALAVTAGLAAAAKVAETGVSPEEYSTVVSALDNAERYYRLTAGEEGGARGAHAFKTVAITWLARQQVASRFAACLGAAEVLYLGLLWQATGDLAAPLVAALAASAVDFAAIRETMPGADSSPSQ